MWVESGAQHFEANQSVESSKPFAYVDDASCKRWETGQMIKSQTGEEHGRRTRAIDPQDVFAESERDIVVEEPDLEGDFDDAVSRSKIR